MKIDTDITYIHDIDTISCTDGELMISDGRTTVVLNTDTLYRDLYILIDIVCKENTKQQDRYKQLIKESCNNI